MSTSPTQRSLKLLRDRGHLCAVVEHWNPFAHIRQDLFGIIDIVSIHRSDGLGWNAETFGVQTTTQPHVAERVAKIRASKAFPFLVDAKWTLIVHGWAKRGPRGKMKTWSCTETVVTP